MSDLTTVRERLDAQRRRFRLLPIGSPGTSHRWTQRRRRGRGITTLLGYGVALGATAVGVVLATSPTTSVAMTATTYRIGDTTLHATGAGTFTGQGALVIAPSGGGVNRAAADVTVDGKHETGVCFVSSSQSQERCIFVIDSGSLSAVDTWIGSGWSRRYDDGQQVTIPATTLAPVPFAVGR
jgi:hypothetical protein